MTKVSDKKKLLIFIPSIEDGGVEKNLFIVSNYLNKKNINIEILTCNNNKKNNFDKGIKIIGTKNPFWFNRSRKIKYLVCLLILYFKLLFNKKKMLVFAFQANIYAIFICKLLNQKIITRSNSSPSGWSKSFLKKKIYTYLIKLADGVMVNSQDFKKEFFKNFNLKTECIYNPLDRSFLKKNKNNKKNNYLFRKNSLKILSVGRLTDQKDHITLLKATKLINSKLKPNVIIVGKGTNYKLLKNFIILNNLQKVVTLTGYSNNPMSYIKQTDILVLTSKFEGLPNVLLEGQLLKKYIISTNCPTGPREILINGMCGDLIKIGDYRSLAKLINNFYNKKKIINNKIKIATKNLNRFNYNINCNKYLNFINRHF